MAVAVSFDLALNRTLRNEDAALRGVVTHDPHDPGGTTRWGISQKFLDEIGVRLKAEKLTLNQAKELYKTHFWDWYHLEALPLDVAVHVFDFLVTSRPQAAFLALQRAARACGEAVTEDGIFGAKTLLAVTRCEQKALLAAFRSERAGYYRALPRAEHFPGWVDRAYRP